LRRTAFDDVSFKPGGGMQDKEKTLRECFKILKIATECFFLYRSGLQNTAVIWMALVDKRFAKKGSILQ
jgi:hypothetical protein